MMMVTLRIMVTVMMDDGDIEGHGDHENDILCPPGFQRLEGMLCGHCVVP